MIIHGVPTALSSREVRALQRLADGRRVSEAGALLGGSTILLAASAASVVSIDRHEGYTAPTFRQFASNLDRAGVAGQVKPVVGDASLLSAFAADLTFIDLTGTFEATLGAIKAATSKVVAIHDVCRTRCDGVEAAIKAAGLHVVEHVDTLAVCVRSI